MLGHPIYKRRAKRRSQLELEALEERTLLSTFFVVRADQADNQTKFDTLAGALGVAKQGDIVQIEPNSSPGSGSVSVALTIQGDPGFSAADLQLIPSLTVQSSSLGTALEDLALGNVTLTNGSRLTIIELCQIGTLTETAGSNNSGGFNLIRDDVISGSVTLGNAAGTDNRDEVINDTFIDGSITTQFAVGFLIQGNTFHGTKPISGPPITVDDSQGQILNNVINVPGRLGIGNDGILVQSFSATTAVTIENNAIRVVGGSQAAGIATNDESGATFSVEIAGNDLVGNQLGVFAFAGPSSSNGFGNIDLGGGSLGSLGGNDFHGYVATPGRFAIATDNLSSDKSATITAEHNIFSLSNPSSVVGPGVDVSNPLSANQAFVDRLYQNSLQRPGSLNELNGWVALIPKIGISGVASDIIHSAEADARLVDQLYFKFLGRPADSAGESFWVKFLQASHTEEDVIAGLLGSNEFYQLAPNLANIGSPDDPDADFVRALYKTLLGRAGSASEISSWVVQLPSLGRTGLVNAITHSLEFRTDQVTSFYVTFLHRSGSANEIAGWARSKLDLLSIEVGFVGSGEFFTNG